MEGPECCKSWRSRSEAAGIGSNGGTRMLQIMTVPIRLLALSLMVGPESCKSWWSQSEATDIAIIGIVKVPDRMSGLKQNVTSPLSGILSAIVIFMTWQTPWLRPMKLKCSYQSHGQHCTCMYGSWYRCGETVVCATFSPFMGEPKSFS